MQYIEAKIFTKYEEYDLLEDCKFTREIVWMHTPKREWPVVVPCNNCEVSEVGYKGVEAA